MTIEEIQKEAEGLYPHSGETGFAKYVALTKQNVFTEAVLSETARKHWEPKWIPVSPETMPKEAKMYNVLSNHSSLPFVDFFKLDFGMFDFDYNNRNNSKRITHYSPLPISQWD